MLFPWLRALGNVLLPGRILGSRNPTDSSRTEQLARRLLREVGLGGFEEHYPAQMSGGMQSRVALARALIYQASTLLMDEPFGALDEFTRDRLNLQLLDVWHKAQATVIFVTHSIQEAIFLADRVTVLSPRPGRIVRIAKSSLPTPQTAGPPFRTRVRVAGERTTSPIGDRHDHGGIVSRNTPSKKSRAAKWQGVVPAAFLALMALVIWQLVVVAAEVPAYIVPSPTEIGRELIAEGPSLVADLGWTMLEAVAGFLIGGGIAFVTAVVFVHVRIVERAAFPWAIVLQTIPIVAIAPLLTIWFGYTLVPKVVIAAIICFFPVLVNTTRGLRSVSSQAMELMSVLSARKASIFWRLRLPSSLPYVFAGLRVAATLSVIGSIVAEFTGADRGIGFVIVQASYRIDTRLMFAAITLSSLAGIVFFHVIGWIERASLRWPEARLHDN